MASAPWPSTGVAVVGLSTGLHATSAVLTALLQRQLAVTGQHLGLPLLDLPFLDVAVALNADQGANFQTNARRMAHPSALRALLHEMFPTRAREAGSRSFDEAGVPWGPILSLPEVVDHPQVTHRQLLQVLKHPRQVDMPPVRNPMLDRPAQGLQQAPAPPSLPTAFQAPARCPPSNLQPTEIAS